MKESEFCVVVCAGPFASLALVKELLAQNNATLIAVDKGFDYLAADLSPDLAIGDFDSTKTPVEVIKEKATKTILLPQEKDKTDFEEALEYAFTNNIRKFAIFGALGGERLDLSLNNLQVATHYANQGCSIVLYDEKSTHQMDLIVAGQEFNLPADTPVGNLVSVLALTDQAQVTISDLKYEFNGTLKAASSLGVANQTVADKAGKVSCQTGVIAIFHRR